MLDREIDDLADLMLIDAALNRGDQRDAQPNLSQPIKCPELLLENARFAAKDAVRF